MKNARKTYALAVPKTPLEIKVEHELASLKSFRKEVTASSEASRKFLQDIGLVDDHGRLTKNYR